RIEEDGLHPLKKFLQNAEEDAYSNDDEAEDNLAEAIEVATSRLRPLSDEQRTALETLRSRARSAANRADAKVLALVDWLNTHIRNGGKWTDERVIIFT